MGMILGMMAPFTKRAAGGVDGMGVLFLPASFAMDLLQLVYAFPTPLESAEFIFVVLIVQISSIVKNCAVSLYALSLGGLVPDPYQSVDKMKEQILRSQYDTLGMVVSAVVVLHLVLCERGFSVLPTTPTQRESLANFTGTNETMLGAVHCVWTCLVDADEGTARLVLKAGVWMGSTVVAGALQLWFLNRRLREANQPANIATAQAAVQGELLPVGVVPEAPANAAEVYTADLEDSDAAYMADVIMAEVDGPAQSASASESGYRYRVVLFPDLTQPCLAFALAIFSVACGVNNAEYF